MPLRSSRRGFTLVEIIVTLVILAVLAAIVVPAMTGWIDSAQQKRLVTACRTAVTAAQTLASEAYGVQKTMTVPDAAEVRALAEVPGTVSGIEFQSGTVQIRHLTYTESGESVTYCALADDHPAHYNFGGRSGFSNAQATSGAITSLHQLATVTYASDYTGRLDSTAVDKPLLTQIQQDHALDALDLAGVNIQSWAVRKESPTQTVVWISDQNIANLNEGDRVRVIRYNDLSGLYTAGYMQVSYRTVQSGGTTTTEPYLTFTGVGRQYWTEAAAGTADPADAFKTFNSLDPVKN